MRVLAYLNNVKLPWKLGRKKCRKHVIFEFNDTFMNHELIWAMGKEIPLAIPVSPPI